MKLLVMTWYKLKMMFCDRLFFAVMVILPLFITIAAGYALRYEKLNLIPIAVVDEDASGYSTKLLQRLSVKEGLKVFPVDRGKALLMLEGNKVEQVFIIKTGFEDRIRSGDSKELIDVVASPSSYSSSFTSEIVAGEVMRFITGDLAAEWVLKEYQENGKQVEKGLRDEILRYNEAFWEPKPLMTIEYKELQGKSGLNSVKRITFPAATATSTGVIVAFLMFYILFSSGWLVEERTNGTIKRLAAGPGALFLSYAGSIFALLIAGSIQILMFSYIDKLLFDVELFPGGLSYLVVFIYLLAVISISLFLSSLLRTQAQLQAGAPVLALMTGFAGGCFWNFVEMPERIKILSMFTPQGWVLDGIKSLIINPADIKSILLPIMVLFAASLILMPLSYIIILMRLKFE